MWAMIGWHAQRDGQFRGRRVEPVAAQFGVAAEHDRDQFVPTCLEFGVGIDVENAQRPTELRRERPELIEQIVAQVAPLATHDHQLAHRAHSPACSVT